MTKAVYLIQARTSSSRLPAKALLPIAGLPLVVLAAKRAGNLGAEVKVLTSLEASDDYLCHVLRKNGIPFFRGNLNNTLMRFVDSMDGYDDETTIVRLTADNIFPDGEFIQQMLGEYIARKLNYICCNGEESGLPYGLSAEAFQLKDIREALTCNLSDYYLEHVTPYLIEKYGRHYFNPDKSIQLNELSCTVDNLTDYLRIAEIFTQVDDPVKDSYRVLIKHLQQTAAPLQRAELVFGGAQFGGVYGINNTAGQPSSKEIETLLNTAECAGVSLIDTAQMYDKSELEIGNYLLNAKHNHFKVITKLSSLTELSMSSSPEKIVEAVNNSVSNSLKLLKVDKLYCLLLHRADHLTDFKGLIWQQLIKLKEAGLIGVLGVSVQTPKELELALNVSEVSHIQMPFNILDHRWESVISMSNIMQRDITIHVRSIFLQGLLLTESEENWAKANFGQQEYYKVTQWLKRLVTKFGRESLPDLCLAYVRSQKWISGIVIGMETEEQLLENVKLLSTKELSTEELMFISDSTPKLVDNNLNPALWITS